MNLTLKKKMNAVPYYFSYPLPVSSEDSLEALFPRSPNFLIDSQTRSSSSPYGRFPFPGSPDLCLPNPSKIQMNQFA